MPTTDRLKLPYILTSQAQKEATHNDTLQILDILLHAVAQDANLNTPPGSPTLGHCYILGTSPTGAWAGKARNIAQAIIGGWYFVAPFKGLRVWVDGSVDAPYFFDGTDWQPEGLLMKDTGEYLRVEHKTEDVTLTGAFKDTTIQIPDRGLVIAVNVRVITAITGCTSFNVGIAGDTGRYGTGIGIALDSTSIGMSGNPITYYANTAIRLTAVGGGASFTAGVVRTTLQYLKPRGPWTW